MKFLRVLGWLTLLVATACNDDDANIVNLISVGFVGGLLVMGVLFLSFLDVWMHSLRESDRRILSTIEDRALENAPELGVTRGRPETTKANQSCPTAAETRR